MLVHVALFTLGVIFALRMFQGGHALFGIGFALFGFAELSYMTYHVNITLFLFAHTISEVLVGAALVTVFAAAVKAGLVTAPVPPTPAPRPRARKAAAR